MGDNTNGALQEEKRLRLAARRMQDKHAKANRHLRRDLVQALAVPEVSQTSAPLPSLHPHPFSLPRPHPPRFACIVGYHVVKSCAADFC